MFQLTKAFSIQKKNSNLPSSSQSLVETGRGFAVMSSGLGESALAGLAAQTCTLSVREFLSRRQEDAEATLPYGIRSGYLPCTNVLCNALLWANQKLLSLRLAASASCLAALIDADEDVLAIATAGSHAAFLIREGQARALFYPQTYGFFQTGLPYWMPPVISDLAGQILSTVPLFSVGIQTDLEPQTSCVRLQDQDYIFLTSDALIEPAFSYFHELFVKKTHQKEPSSDFFTDLAHKMHLRISRSDWSAVLLKCSKTSDC
jgi:hypothetical protein